MPDVFGHPWLGGLFADAESAALWSPTAQLAAMRAFEAAWVRALAAAGLEAAAPAEAAAQAIEAMEFDLADLRAGTARDGVVVPRLVAQIKGRAPAVAVHRGATSQDVIDSALAIAMRDTLALLETRLAALEEALATLEGRFGAQPLQGRTRMQAATMISVSDRLQSWRAPLARHRARIAEIAPRVAVVQIGGASGDRADLGAAAGGVVEAVARALNLAPAPRAWHSQRDGVAEFAGLLSLVTGTLGKIGQDICLMAQQGINEITLAGGGGSSAMAHKQNPILAELLVTLARFNATQLGALHQALIHEQERSGAAWALEWMCLPQVAEATGRATAAALELLSSVRGIGAV